MNRLDVVAQVLGCTGCELHERCTLPVALRGEPGPVCVVGEAPGEQEDLQGQPFVGPAGRLLDEYLTAAGLTGPFAYVNTVSCFPHGTPTWDHIRACEQNKWDQIELIDPTYVLLLGRVALKATRPDLDIKRGRGRPFWHRGRLHYATYHPAAALRNDSYADSLRDDLARFKELMDAGDDWHLFIPDVCAACPIEVAWIEEAGLGWCPKDMPTQVRKQYEARQAVLDAEIHAARTRKAPATASAAWTAQMKTAAEQRAADGIAAVEAAADPDWMDEAWTALVDYLHTHQEFFVDDLWSTGLSEPREARALGPLVLRASREKMMRKSGRFRKSVRSNMTEKPIWTSLVCSEAATNG